MKEADKIKFATGQFIKPILNMKYPIHMLIERRKKELFEWKTINILRFRTDGLNESEYWKVCK